jgi:hypothetical protein
MSRKLAILLALMLAVGTAQAGKIVKYTLPSGEVIYSDKPPPEATSGEEVTVEPLQTFSAPAAPPLEDSTAKDDEPKPAGYEDFRVTSPTNDTVIRDHGGNVSVSLSLTPGLQGGHSIEVMMDGQSIGSGRSTSLTLTEVDRGTHTVQAMVKDRDGKEIARSNSVIFHLKRGGG